MDTSIKSSQTKRVEYVLMKSIWKLYFFWDYGYPCFIFEFESIGCHPESLDTLHKRSVKKTVLQDYIAYLIILSRVIVKHKRRYIIY